MKLAVLRERDPGEPRVAATPETIKKIRALGPDVTVEAGAGVRSGIPDADYAAAGADVAASAEAARGDADIILKVRRPQAGELDGYKRGALVIAIMAPFGNKAELDALAKPGVTAYAME